MTREELLELQIELNTTDLEITVIAYPDPALVGEKLVYTLRVINHGPSPAFLTQVVDTLPLGASYQSGDAGCVESPTGTLTCDLGVIWARESKEIIINVMIDADALINEAGPMTITNKASVANLVRMRMLEWGYTALVFPDYDPTNNGVSQETLVVKR